MRLTVKLPWARARGDRDAAAAVAGAAVGLGRRLVSGAAWSLGGAVVSRSLGLVSTIVAARLLVPRRFGQLSLLETGVLLLGSFATLGLKVVATKRVAETRRAQPELAGTYVGSCLILTALFGLVIAAALARVAPAVASHLLLDRHLSLAVIGSIGAMWFSSITAVQGGVLTGLESWRLLVVSQTFESLLASVLLVGGIAIGGLTGGTTGWMIGEGLAAAAGCYCVLAGCRARAVRPRFSLRGAHWRSLSRLGAPALVAALVVEGALLGSQRLLAGTANGLSRVAAFNIAYRWQLLVLFVPSSLAPVVLPVVASLHTEGSNDQVARVFRINLVVNVLLVVVAGVVVLVLGPELLGLAGHFYSGRTGILFVLLIGALPVVLNNVLSQTALGLGAVAPWAWSDVVLGLVLMAAALVLVAPFGSSGLAWAYTAGYTATCAVLAAPVHRRIRQLVPRAVDRPGLSNDSDEQPCV
ncbi:MAG TPA: oligosaccharide flippase family protein [Acidimicrobiales bacterium]|nr:oligosaccharide flippase family protein [Acidimicrobiales bacterium]